MFSSVSSSSSISVGSNNNFYNSYKCIKDESNLIISFCVECNEPLSLKSITSNAHRGHTFQDIEYIIKCEQLFWKVFNNKLIRDNIFLMMEQTPLHKKHSRLLQSKIISTNNSSNNNNNNNNNSSSNVNNQNLYISISSTNNPYYFNRIKFKYIRSLGFMVKRKLWNLLEIKLKADEYILIKARDLYLFLKVNRDLNLISLLYEKKKEQLRMFDLVECAYSLDNQVALEYYLSVNVQTYLSNYCLFNSNGNDNINGSCGISSGFSISSIKSLELLLKYKVNLIDSSSNNNTYNINNNNNNNNNNNSNNNSNCNNNNNNKNNNNIEYSTKYSKSYFNNSNNSSGSGSFNGGLTSSNSNYNLSIYNNNNNNSLTRSASCSSISSCNSSDGNGNSGISGSSSSYSNNSNSNSNSNISNNNSNSNSSKNYNIPPPPSYRYFIAKEKIKTNSAINYLLPQFRLLNMGNIQEALDQFNPIDYSKISYQMIKKCLKYSNIKDLERLFSAIANYSPGIPFDRFSQSVLCGRKDVYSLIVKIYPEFFNQLSFNQSIRQTIIRGDLDMLSFLIETFRDMLVVDYSKDLKNELIELAIKNNNHLILNYLLKNFK